jgi:PTS system nitrogen regulatory IIA component
MPLPDGVDRDELYSVLVAREALCSTGMGNGVAIPHPRGPIVLGISEPQVTLVFPQQPFDYGALDGKPVSILFVIVSTSVRVHLQLLSHLMFGLQDEAFRQLLNERVSQDEIFSRLEAIESQMTGVETGQGASR